jgi:RNA polymerase sigma factor (sigma-70 family)
MVEVAADRRRRFDALFDAYRTDVIAYCRWRSPSPDEWEDAVADVFLVTWRRIDDVPSGDAARAWLYATAHRVIANQRRSRRRRDTVRERMAHEVVKWPRFPAAHPEEALVHEALALLGTKDREILLLAEWENLTPAEIARVIGCLAVTARSRLHRARRRFRDEFESLRARERSSSKTRSTSTPHKTTRIRKVHT